MIEPIIYCIVSLMGYYGVIDIHGNEIIPISYYSIAPFENDRFISAKLDTQSQTIKYGALNSLGEVVVPFEYDWITPFYQGRAFAANEGITLRIDTLGHSLDTLTFLQVIWDNGMLQIRGESGWGYMNHQYQIVVAPIYKQISKFNDQGFCLAQDSSGAYINFNHLGEPSFTSIYPWRVLQELDGYYILENQLNQLGLVNHRNEFLLPFEYQSIDFQFDPLNTYSIRDTYRLRSFSIVGYNEKLKQGELFRISYGSIERICSAKEIRKGNGNNLFIQKRKGSQGVQFQMIDTAGHLAWDVSFDSLAPIYHGNNQFPSEFYFEKGNQRGIMDGRGNTHITFEGSFQNRLDIDLFCIHNNNDCVIHSTQKVVLQDSNVCLQLAIPYTLGLYIGTNNQAQMGIYDLGQRSWKIGPAWDSLYYGGLKRK